MSLFFFFFIYVMYLFMLRLPFLLSYQHIRLISYFTNLCLIPEYDVLMDQVKILMAGDTCITRMIKLSTQRFRLFWSSNDSINLSLQSFVFLIDLWDFIVGNLLLGYFDLFHGIFNYLFFMLKAYHRTPSKKNKR